MDNKPCPLCNDSDYSFMLHKGVMREVNALTVYCPEQHTGCDWVGELGKVSCHLNLTSRDSGCHFVKIECANKCGSMIFRKDLQVHEKEECSKRCSSFSGSAEFYSALDAIKQLKREVKEIKDEKMRLKADLSNSNLQLQNLQSKIISMEGTVLHLSQKVQAGEQERAKLKNGMLQLEQDLQKVVQVERDQILCSLKVTKLVADQAVMEEKAKHVSLSVETRLTPLPPIHFVLHNYHYYKDNNFHWQSEPFYSTPQGYRFIVSIYPNGISKGKGNYLSLFISILGGQYDNDLKWPFRGVVVIQIYNYSMSQWVERKPVAFEGTDSIGYTGKPEGFNSTNPGLGFPQWLRLSELQQDYCHKGMVKFKVEKVTICT